MSYYSISGYANSGAAYCETCAVDVKKTEGYFSPIFNFDEFDYQPVCDTCCIEIDVVVLEVESWK